ncbi:unnamed protein product [Polarella glacialis]|nr:unnamed protein product [Polarella glacialis]
MPESLPGFDVWLANDGGSYISPSFQVKNIAGLPDGHVQFTSDASNYSTAIIGNASLAWIKEVAGKGQPFFAYIAPKAAHEPFNPAPWYRDHWDPSWPSQEPRPQNWNCSAESRQNHHGNIASQPMITEEAAEIVTGVFKNRWRTLMSVDDLIADVFSALETQGVLDNTYIFFSSDHGFQLGQFNILMDKRHTYEWDTKIHLVARGPGIEAGSSFAAPSTQVDIAPTILGLAGLEAPETMDGKSVVPFLLSSRSEVLASLLPSTRQHLQGLGDLTDYAAKWRQEVFIEYYYNDYNSKCVTHKECGSQRNDYPNSDSNCVDLASNSKCWCNHNTAQEPDCYPTETSANNFAALRTFTVEGANHLLYAEFQPGDQAESNIDFKKADFTELFDVQNDPWEMNNLANDPAFVPVRTKLHKKLHAWLACSGSSCA